jgi:hypothetical protein
MTRRLEELFDFPPAEDSIPESKSEPTRTQLAEIDAAIDKIDAALPTVRDLATGDGELDDLANMAKESYDNLMDLGMQIDSRYSSEIFAVASNMLGHAITAKTAKLNKKLKMVDLQLKKLKMDQDQASKSGDTPTETAHGQVLSRNDLLERLIASGTQNNNKA